MRTAARRSPVARAFTLIELIAVIVVLAILSGVAIPKYFDYAANAKISSTKGTLGGVRSAIANYYASQAVAGAPAYPAINLLTTPGTVMQEPIAANPYNNDATVAAASWAATPPTAGNSGWNYDAATGHFWANTTTAGSNLW